MNRHELCWTLEESDFDYTVDLVLTLWPSTPIRRTLYRSAIDVQGNLILETQIAMVDQMLGSGPDLDAVTLLMLERERLRLYGKRLLHDWLSQFEDHVMDGGAGAQLAVVEAGDHVDLPPSDPGYPGAIPLPTAGEKAHELEPDWAGLTRRVNALLMRGTGA